MLTTEDCNSINYSNKLRAELNALKVRNFFRPYNLGSFNTPKYYFDLYFVLGIYNTEGYSGGLFAEHLGLFSLTQNSNPEPTSEFTDVP